MVNIMAQGLSTPDPSLRHTPLYKDRSRNNYTLHTHGVALYYTSRFPVVAHWASLAALACEGSVCHPKGERKKERCSREQCAETLLLWGQSPWGFPQIL